MGAWYREPSKDIPRPRARVCVCLFICLFVCLSVAQTRRLNSHERRRELRKRELNFMPCRSTGCTRPPQNWTVHSNIRRHTTTLSQHIFLGASARARAILTSDGHSRKALGARQWLSLPFATSPPPLSCGGLRRLRSPVCDPHVGWTARRASELE